ncbi:MarR family winged helix-turn-helix transcriptional regulator [Xanthobacter autotrophicus]|uniref:MarR family winged helix-turn-helix transcriptional regulator n=1 Tax=Xanthobacter autotrophicus TaxID=280 RepID=UPI0037266545
MSADISPLLPKLLRATYWFDEALRMSQEAQGQVPVTKTQALLLINIALGERRPVRLARALGVTKQAVSLMLAELSASGRIAITPDPEDARASLVGFSPSGRDELTFIFETLCALEDHLATVIGRDRMEVLRTAFEIDWGPPPVLSPGSDQAGRPTPVRKTGKGGRVRKDGENGARSPRR